MKYSVLGTNHNAQLRSLLLAKQRMKYAVLGTNHNTVLFCKIMEDAGVPPDLVISLLPGEAKVMAENDRPVCGYEPRPGVGGRCGVFCEAQTDRNMSHFIEGDFHGCDVLFVVGWHWRVPRPVRERFRGCMYGMHATHYELPDGRGHSPVAWAIRRQADALDFCVLEYDNGFDTGRYMWRACVEVEPGHTVRQLQAEVTQAMAGFAFNYINNHPKVTTAFKTQPVRPHIVLPRLTPEDGRLVWRDNAHALRALVNAHSDPYPGAWFVHDTTIRVHHATASDAGYAGPLGREPGTVLWTHGPYVCVLCDNDTTLTMSLPDHKIKAGEVLQ